MSNHFNFVTYQGRDICFLALPQLASKALKCGASYFGIKPGSVVIPFGGLFCAFFKSFIAAENFIGYLKTLGFVPNHHVVTKSLWSNLPDGKAGNKAFTLVYVPILEIPVKQILIKNLCLLSRKYKNIVKCSY